jgi:hypothetical protein
MAIRISCWLTAFFRSRSVLTSLCALAALLPVGAFLMLDMPPLNPLLAPALQPGPERGSAECRADPCLNHGCPVRRHHASGFVCRYRRACNYSAALVVSTRSDATAHKGGMFRVATATSPAAQGLAAATTASRAEAVWECPGVLPAVSPGLLRWNPSGLGACRQYVRRQRRGHPNVRLVASQRENGK